MAPAYREAQTKFDVPTGFAMPELAGITDDGGDRASDGRGGSVELSEVRLISTYYDTEDRALARLGRTLRLRQSPDRIDDAGWRLKASDGGDRLELRADADENRRFDGALPEQLAILILGATHGRPVGPIAQITVQRTRRRLLDVHGELLLEITDDDVHAVSMDRGERSARRWRALEVELGTGPRELMERSEGVLSAAGARPAIAASKLERVLGAQLSTPRAKRMRKRTTYGAIVLGYLFEQFDAIESQDLHVRHCAADAVHRQRVATRRARSALRVFHRLFDPAPAAHLDEQLKWFAGMLGAVRDREVLRARLSEHVRVLPDELVLGPVAATIDRALLAEQREHAERLDEAMAGERYLELLVLLDRWRSKPPVDTARAARPASRAIRDVRRADENLCRKLARADEAHGDDRALHSARKQAKRMRYALEAIRDLEAIKPRRRIKHGKRSKHSEHSKTRARRRALAALQDDLGAHQDAVAAVEFLRRLAAATDARGGVNAFTYGVLLEQVRAAADRSAQAALRRQ